MSMYEFPNPRPVVTTDPSKGAKQSFKAECDINNIMNKYRVTGLVTHVARSQGRFADVSSVGSYQEAIHRVRDAREFFEGLPAEMRGRFRNDASAFLDFILDPANEAEVQEMGLDKTLARPGDAQVDLTEQIGVEEAEASEAS